MATLRAGITTGLCAAAAAKAAAAALLGGEVPGVIEITAKTGAVFRLDITDAVLKSGSAVCAVRKYAGDDPDVTDGLKIFAEVTRTATDGIIEVDGGEGIGRVTKPGLKVPVGMAAINPVPREMIMSALAEVRERFGCGGGLRAVISIPGGAEIAKQTMNERLGIIGGLSILGTTGIVEPMSERALVETIKTEIDVQTAAGKTSLLVTPGNYGRDFAELELGLNIDDAVKCSNYIGDTLDYANLKGIAEIVLIGHAGKLVKLAGGVMNTHSRVADCRMEIIAAHCAMAGAGAGAIHAIMDCITVEAAIAVMERLGINGAVWESIGERIGYYLRNRTRGSVSVEYIVFTQEHGVLVRSRT